MPAPSVKRMQTFAESAVGLEATNYAGRHRSAYRGGPAHPETVKDALLQPDGRFYGGAQDAVAVLQGLLDAALRENERLRSAICEHLDSQVHDDNILKAVLEVGR